MQVATTLDSLSDQRRCSAAARPPLAQASTWFDRSDNGETPAARRQRGALIQSDFRSVASAPGPIRAITLVDESPVRARKALYSRTRAGAFPGLACGVDVTTWISHMAPVKALNARSRPPSSPFRSGGAWRRKGPSPGCFLLPALVCWSYRCLVCRPAHGAVISFTETARNE